MKKKLIITLIILLTTFSIIVTIYKFVKFNNARILKEYIEIEVKEEKLQIEDNTDYKEFYIENTKSYNYEIIKNESGIIGKIFIGENNYIYSYDTLNKTHKKLSNIKFLSLKEEHNTRELFSIYAISTENDLYRIYLDNNNVDDIKVINIKLDYKVIKFVDVNYKTLETLNGNSVMLLSKEEKIYDIKTGMMYNKDILYLNTGYYIYPDKSIANNYGNLIKDENGNSLKIKHYIETWEEDKPFKNVDSIIITSDNRIIFKEKYSNIIKISLQRVKGIKTEQKHIDIKEYKIMLILENDKEIIFTGLCYGDYYCVD